ncbi:MAG: alkaline phosphatase [Bacteroidales bacterium]|jgi:alkaline phosphatase|nr:alkaline phosphatase [Bacteroidales bacterium]
MNRILTRASVFGCLLSISIAPVYAQENYKEISKEDITKVYRANGNFYAVPDYSVSFPPKKRPKNIIVMIGDGMGLAQVYAGMTANGGRLFLDNFKNVGFARTHSGDNYVTDSAAGGTALSTGVKTKNDVIGLDINYDTLQNVRELAQQRGKATGVLSTSAITHATPASFLAHRKSRSYYEDIALDITNSGVDVFIGGGYKHFTKRADDKDLTVDLKKKGYQVLRTIEEVAAVKDGKVAGLLAPEHTDRLEKRGNILPVATKTAIDILSKDKDGFFLMVEGSQIDWGGHQNNVPYIVEEMTDFDRAIGVALEFAAKNKETLIIVTADHETGGLAIANGNLKNGTVNGLFPTGGHTAIPVPVFSFGPGANRLTGFMENTDIANIVKEFLNRK